MSVTWYRDRRWWAAVIVLSLAGRALAFWFSRDGVPTGDSHNYLVIAREILAGRGMAITDPYIGSVRAMYPPVMPLVLAAIGLAVPLSLVTISILNTAIDFGCAALIRRLGARNGDEPAGAGAAMAYLLWPANLALSPVAHKEGLLCLFVAALALFVTRLSDRPAPAIAAGFGIVAALLALTQPGLAPLPALFAIIACFRMHSWRSRVSIVAVAALAGALTMAPWWIRNWLLFGRFVPLTSVGGYSLWVGTTPTGEGRYLPPPEGFRGGGELAVSAELGRIAGAEIAAHPADFAARAAVKVARAFASDEWAVAKLAWQSGGGLPRGMFLAWAIAGTLAHALALVAGLATALIRRSWMPCTLLLACIAQVLIFGIWFEFDQRHRYFLLPLLLVCAAHGLSRRHPTVFDERRSSTVSFD